MYRTNIHYSHSNVNSKDCHRPNYYRKPLRNYHNFGHPQNFYHNYKTL